MTIPTTKPSVRVAVVGCGHWGQNLARNFARENALEALVDAFPGAADKLAAQLSKQGFDIPRVSTWEEALKDTSIDAVALATPAPQHADMAVAALTAGKNVFIEKPLALSVEDGQRIVRAAETAGKLVMVGHLVQYHPAFIQLKALVREGRLGRVKHIHARRLGFGRIRENEGVFWDLGSHDISTVLALADDMPVAVTAQGCHPLRSQIEDVATAELTFASGLQAHIFVSWLYPQTERKLIVVGDRATAIFDDSEPWETKLRVYGNTISWTDGVPAAVKGDVEVVAFPPNEPLALECQHFLDCVKSGQQPITGADESLRVVEVLCWIENQIRQNQSSNASVASSTGSLTQSPSTASIDSALSDSTPNIFHSDSSHHARDVMATDKHTGGGVVKSMDPIPLMDLASQKARIQDALNHRLTKVMNHTTFILGPEVRELEARLAEYSGAAHVVACGSGTGALTLALMALNLQPGDAVLVPDFSFVGTVEPIALLGGIPVFVDVEPQNLTIDPSLIGAGVAAAKKAGHKAVGIIAVDLFGHPARYDELHEAAARHGLWVMGDAAQSFGASSGGRRVGSLARVTTTSFFPSKPLGCYGDGGAVFTDDSEMAELLISLRQHGLDAAKSNGLRIGLNSRLDTIQAAVLLCKLDLHEEEIGLRDEVAARYTELLTGTAALPSTHDDAQSAWATYTIRVKQRDAVRKYLSDNGIASAVYYAIPFHKQHAYQKFPIIEGSCPVAERACDEVLSLPMSPYLDFVAQNRIANTLRDALVQIERGE
ncbi:DegT/DnrJ/EryC1/StrS aminotransferase family-domain-containing protein [Nemania sp. FL0031]|nr:DegT/DnrJ/EryC1/StrS aminotransferase family-domain-containing protein [Nemania sp. FL0031]